MALQKTSNRVLAFSMAEGKRHRHDGVRGVSDSPEGMTPQSLAPKDQMTPPWKK